MNDFLYPKVSPVSAPNIKSFKLAAIKSEMAGRLYGPNHLQNPSKPNKKTSKEVPVLKHWRAHIKIQIPHFSWKPRRSGNTTLTFLHGHSLLWLSRCHLPFHQTYLVLQFASYRPVAHLLPVRLWMCDHCHTQRRHALYLFTLQIYEPCTELLCTVKKKIIRHT